MTASPPRVARSSARAEIVAFWRVLSANPLTLVGFLLVGVISVAALLMVVAPHVLAPFTPLQATGAYNHAPSATYLLGTDGNGFDLYSNIMYALPLDLGIGFAVAGFALVFGGALGLVAGYWDSPGTVGGYTSLIILRLTDIFLSFPSLILALAITVSLGRGAWQAVVAVMITWWPYYVRLVRGEVLAVKHLPYVMAARAAGVSNGRIVLRHVLRNVLEPLVVYFTLDVGTVLVTFSTIGYVAAAIPYPSLHPEWGSMISYYQAYGLLIAYPWEVLAPGAAIFITVLAFSLLGDGLRDVLDPRSRRALTQAAGRLGSQTEDALKAEKEEEEESAPEGGLPGPAAAGGGP